MRYGYTRISTAAQENNTSLDDQESLIKNYYPDAEIIVEIYSGAKKREKFEKLIEQMQPGDLLCCARLDRFCRTTKEGLEYIDFLLEKGCSVHLLDVGLIDDTAAGRMLLTVFFAFAEFDRRRIIERTKIGREKARLRPGYRDGRKPVYKKAQLDHAVELLAEHSYKEVEEMTGISVSTIQRHRRKLIAEEKASQTI